MMRAIYWITPVLCTVVGLINCWQDETLEGISWFILAWLMYIAELLAELLEKRP